MDQPWWIVGCMVVVGLYWGWRAYLHHRYPVQDPFKED